MDRRIKCHHFRARTRYSAERIGFYDFRRLIGSNRAVARALVISMPIDAMAPGAAAIAVASVACGADQLSYLLSIITLQFDLF